jgi:hypothetical protein
MRRAAVLIALALALALAACTPTIPSDAGCATYGAERSHMPRPLPDGKLGTMVTLTDAAMTGACR